MIAVRRLIIPAAKNVFIKSFLRLRGIKMFTVKIVVKEDSNGKTDRIFKTGIEAGYLLPRISKTISQQIDKGPMR